MVLLIFSILGAFARFAFCRVVLSPVVFMMVLSLFSVATIDASAQGPGGSDDREDATICVELTQLAEHTRRFPKGLLYAIARVESGRQVLVNSTPTPWPWTVTVEGEGRYYASKKEAVKAVEQFQRDGNSNIDVGCMQVNLLHHGRAFRSVSEAIDPVNNVAYATEYLVVLYKRYNNWEEAIKYYHSSDPTKHNYYLARVKRVWESSRAPRATARGGVVRRKKTTKNNAPILSGDEAFQLERESLLLSDDLRKKLGVVERTARAWNDLRTKNGEAVGGAAIANSAQNLNANFFLNLIDEPL